MINAIFALLQFLIFCMCCAYMVRKYLPVLKKQRDDEYARRRLLEESCSDLQKTLINTDNSHQEKISECDILFKKVELWKNNFEDHSHTCKEDQSEFFKQAYERRKKQLMMHEAQKIQARLFPVVVAQAREVLQQQFLQGNCVHYNDICIRKLENKKGLY